MKKLFTVIATIACTALCAQQLEKNLFTSYNISNDNPIGLKIGIAKLAFNSGL
jgi:hypothetical protein